MLVTWDNEETQLRECSKICFSFSIKTMCYNFKSNLFCSRKGFHSRCWIHELRVLLSVNDLNRVQSSVLWLTRHLVPFIFLTWVFKRAAGRAEGCKAASMWSRQVRDSMSNRAEQHTFRASGLSYNPAAAQTSCVSLWSFSGHSSSLSCKRFGFNRTPISSHWHTTDM